MSADMASSEMKVVGLCNCCLQEDGTKRLREEYYNCEGELENYGEMLSECFILPSEYSMSAYICEICIIRLREAFKFKQQVINAAEQLLVLTAKLNESNEANSNGKNEISDAESDYHIIFTAEAEDEKLTAKLNESNEANTNGKNEISDAESDYHIIFTEEAEDEKLITELEEADADVKLAEEEFEYLIIKNDDDKYDETIVPMDYNHGEQENNVDQYFSQYVKVYNDLESHGTQNPDSDIGADNDFELKDGAQYLEVEYLEDDHHVSEEEEDVPPPVKRKWPKKKKKHELTRTYKNYTREDLENSLEAVRSGRLSRAQSAIQYGVPRKTVTGFLRKEQLMKENPDMFKVDDSKKYSRYFDDKEKLKSRQKQLKLLEEIRKILMYTNATPFKSGTNKLYCAYCNTEGPYFEDDPHGLRTHTRTEHVADRIRGVEFFMKPFWCSEILRMDIYNLVCTICNAGLRSWKEMTEHLESHGKKLDSKIAWSKIVPYILKTSGQKCALCNLSCPNFHHLDSHMNSHYNNHVCDECGESFLTDLRLKRHREVHSEGKYPCEACGKVFKLEKYRKKHFVMVHSKKLNIKCQYCHLKFHTLTERHQHAMEAHKELVPMLNCELCGMVFTKKPNYFSHLRKVHAEHKEYKCKICSEVFSVVSDYRAHKLSHKEKKKFTCKFCVKSYCNNSYLKQHYLHVHQKELNSLLSKKQNLKKSTIHVG